MQEVERNTPNQLVLTGPELIVSTLKNAIIEMAKTRDEIQILSIASGSAQGLFVAINSLRKAGFTKKVRILLLYLNPSALTHGVQLAAQYGILSNDIITVNSKPTSIPRVVSKARFHPQIVEMTGLQDYLSKQTAMTLMREIFEIVREDGRFIMCHTHPSFERRSIRRISCSKVPHKNGDYFLNLIKQSAPWSVKAITESNGLCTVVICKRSPCPWTLCC